MLIVQLLWQILFYLLLVSRVRVRALSRSAAFTMELLKLEQIDNQKTLMRVQNELIQSKDEQVKDVQTTLIVTVLGLRNKELHVW